MSGVDEDTAILIKVTVLIIPAIGRDADTVVTIEPRLSENGEQRLVTELAGWLHGARGHPRATH